MRWANDQGCDCKCGIVTTSNGETVTPVYIVAPSGKFVHHVENSQADRLSPSIVRMLDRRLGLKSPWIHFGFGDDPED